MLSGASFRSSSCPTSFRVDHNKQLMVEAKYDSYNNNNANLFQFIIYSSDKNILVVTNIYGRKLS